MHKKVGLGLMAFVILFKTHILSNIFFGVTANKIYSILEQKYAFGLETYVLILLFAFGLLVYDHYYLRRGK